MGIIDRPTLMPAQTTAIQGLIETAIQKKNDMVEQELRLYVEANGYRMNAPRLRFSINVKSHSSTTTETYTAMLPDGSVKRILRVEQTQASVDIIPLWRMKGVQSCIITTQTRKHHRNQPHNKPRRPIVTGKQIGRAHV